MATRNSTQRKPVKAPRLAPVPKPAEKSALPKESVDYVDERLTQAAAISSILIRVFGGEYSTDHRAGDGVALTALQYAERLLSECRDHLDSFGHSSFVSDPWRAALDGGAALLEVLERLTFANGMSTDDLGDTLMSDYVWTIDGAIKRAQVGLDAAQVHQGASHE